MEVEIITQQLVVVTGDIHHPGASLRLGDDLVNDLIVDCGPIPTGAHLPEIEDISHQIEIVAIGVFEEVEEIFGAGGAEAEVGIGYEETLIA